MNSEDLRRRVNLDVPAPAGQPSYIPVLSPRAGCRVDGVIICPRPVKTITHYIGEHTVPCIGQANNCKGCRRRQQRRWKAWLGIQENKKRRLAIAEVTAWAAKRWLDQLEDAGVNLRGWLVGLSRPPGQANGRVTMELQPPPLRGDPYLPEAFDLEVAMLHIWERHVEEAGPEDEALREGGER